MKYHSAPARRCVVTSLRRLDDGTWQVYANAPFMVNLDAKPLEWSVDGKAWQAVAVGSEIGPGRGQPRQFTLRVR